MDTTGQTSPEVVIIGDDAGLRERFEGQARSAPAWHVLALRWDDLADLVARHPAAVILNVRSPSAETLEAIARLKASDRPPPVMLQVTPRQMRDHSWDRLFLRATLFTPRTRKREVHSRLRSLLAPADAGWRIHNDHRIDLIFKKWDQGLTPAEEHDLAQLQAESAHRIDRRATLDFDALAESEEAARRIIQGKQG